MIKEQKIEGVGLLKGVTRLVNAIIGKGLSERRSEMPIDLYKEFLDWFKYSFPSMYLTPFQEKAIKAILTEHIPITKKELAKRLEKLLPGKTK